MFKNTFVFRYFTLNAFKQPLTYVSGDLVQISECFFLRTDITSKVFPLPRTRSFLGSLRPCIGLVLMEDR